MKKARRSLDRQAEDGPWERVHAYQMIDGAPAGTHFYRMSLDPDPAGEDLQQDLDLRGLTIHTLRTLEELVAKQVTYVAAIYADHTMRRHVYLVAAVPRRLNAPELTKLSDAATALCREQRRARDRDAARSREPEPEEEEPWQW